MMSGGSSMNRSPGNPAGANNAGNTSPSRRTHTSKVFSKEGIPRDNIKQFKPKKAAENVFNYKFINLPKHLKNKYDFVSLDSYMTEDYANGSRITLPTQCPNKEKKLYKLKLRLTAPFDSSYKMAVLGSIPELGNNQTYKCFMRFSKNNEWVLDEPILTRETFFTYKYVVIQGDAVQPEEGVARIADLEVLPEQKSEQTEFIAK
jgi:hypothetical protein